MSPSGHDSDQQFARSAGKTEPSRTQDHECGEASSEDHQRGFRGGEHQRTGAGVWLSEVLATFGLVVLIFGLVRSGRGPGAAYGVGAYIAAAYWWSSSTSFANPMVDLARTLSDTFAGIAPTSVPMFVLMQFLGAALGVIAVAVLYPQVRQDADRVVLPHSDFPARTRGRTAQPTAQPLEETR